MHSQQRITEMKGKFSQQTGTPTVAMTVALAAANEGMPHQQSQCEQHEW